MQGLLNDWRRTHYAKQTTPEIAGSDVTIMGWVHEIRDLGGIIFVIIRDVTGRVQLTAPSKKVDAEILEEIRKFNKELYILLLTGHKDLAPPLETIKRLDIQGYCEKSDKFDQLQLLIESGLKSIKQMVVLD